MQKCLLHVQKAVYNFFRHPQVNIIVTCIFIFVFTYAALILITEQNITYPFVDDLPSLNHNCGNTIGKSFLSLYFFIVLSLVAGKVADLLCLPPIFGGLLLGILVKNVSFLNNIFYVDFEWHYLLRILALVNIIVRWGLTIDYDFIKENLTFTCILGIGSVTAEACAIATFAFFLLDMAPGVAIICAFLVGTTSGVVPAPAMAKLATLKLECDKKLPSLTPAACTFDTSFSLTAFTIASSLTFTTDSWFSAMGKAVGAVVIGAAAGYFFGWLLSIFPRHDARHCQLARFLILTSASTAVILSMVVQKHQYAGIVCCLVMSVIAGTNWRQDNPKKIKIIFKGVDNMWHFVSSPLLSLIIGYSLDVKEDTWGEIVLLVAMIATGIVARIVSGMIISACGQFNSREQLVLTLSLVGKATVQLALAPSLTIISQRFPQHAHATHLVSTACIISVLITTPVIHVLLNFIAPMLLCNEASQTVHATENRTQLVDDTEKDPDSYQLHKLHASDVAERNTP